MCPNADTEFAKSAGPFTPNFPLCADMRRQCGSLMDGARRTVEAHVVSTELYLFFFQIPSSSPSFSAPHCSCVEHPKQTEHSRVELHAVFDRAIIETSIGGRGYLSQAGAPGRKRGE